MSVQLAILIGLPASGKSTFYHQRLASTHVHISKDRLRHHRHPQRRQEQLIAEAFSHARSVAVDNVNATMGERTMLIGLAREYGAEVVGYYFPTEIGDALRRNRTRAGKARVPDVALFTARKRLQVPSLAEGFDRLLLVRLDEANREFHLNSLGAVI